MQALVGFGRNGGFLSVVTCKGLIKRENGFVASPVLRSMPALQDQLCTVSILGMKSE